MTHLEQMLEVFAFQSGNVFSQFRDHSTRKEMKISITWTSVILQRVLLYKIDYFMIARLVSYVQRCPPLAIQSSAISATFHQECCNSDWITCPGDMQWGTCLPVQGFNLGSTFQQDICNVVSVRLRCSVEGGVAFIIHSADIASVSDKQLYSIARPTWPGKPEGVQRCSEWLVSTWTVKTELTWSCQKL